MKVSEKALKWAMRFYPPLLLQRVWIRSIGKDFRSAEVKVFRSVFNLNYNRSIFGGTIFAAADPFYPVLFFQALKKRGINARIWVARSEIDYIKPAYTSLVFKIVIRDDDLHEITSALQAEGKLRKSFSIEMLNLRGELCSRVLTEIYIRTI
jgi:hypothetical protein